MIRCSSLLCLIMLGLFSSRGTFAQISVDASDVGTQFGVGSMTTNQYDSTSTTLNIGNPGAGTWDFSGLQTSSTLNLTSVAVSETPFVARYPGATHALQTSVLYQGLPATAYIYFKLGTNLSNMGQAASVQNGAASVIAINTPVQLLYPLPATYGSAWSASFLDSTIIYLDGVPMTGSGLRHAASFVVDGYGTMTLPGGKQLEALRVRKTDTTLATPSGKSAIVVGYMFLAKDGTLIQVNGANPSAPDSGVITVAPPISWETPVVSSVGPSAVVPGIYALGQNYPNPFNPSTVIAYDLPVESRVRIVVYDILGREIKSLVDERESAGHHQSVFSAASIPTGVYFCRLQAEPVSGGRSFVDVKRMVLLR